ncbi:MAG: 23S rRNA (adenine(1618)-N(6))-methyltransferase RlmF [Vicinamibacterales bacterium]
MHARNRFRDGYDFPRLTAAHPPLAAFVVRSPRGDATIDFANSAAVLALNQALLKDAYGLQWSLPTGALCPAVPGRLDYVHHLADLLSGGDTAAIPRGPDVPILDIGSGASCIYPLLGASEYGWSFVATDSDLSSHRWARQIVRINRSVAARIEGRHQPDPRACFANVTTASDHFAASMCNPPFHASAEDAAAGSTRKRRNLKLAPTAAPLNFGGAPGELWCEGGEVGFIERMIAESAARPRLCFWFTTLVSKSANLPRLERTLARVQAAQVRTLDMAQGQKQSRILAWTFMRP